MFPALNLPEVALKIQENQVWDILQKKYRPLTPEEWVRQQFTHFLINEKSVPVGKMASEVVVPYNGMKKRADLVLYDDRLAPVAIVECKASHIPITENTFFQITRYCHTLQACCIILTNGMDHYSAYIDQKKGELTYLKELPSYSDILKYNQ